MISSRNLRGQERGVSTLERTFGQARLVQVRDGPEVAELVARLGLGDWVSKRI